MNHSQISKKQNQFLVHLIQILKIQNLKRTHFLQAVVVIVHPRILVLNFEVEKLKCKNWIFLINK
jgi:hypothetical protein